MIKKSKILIVSAVFPPEPVVSALITKDIADELVKKHEIVIICPNPTRPIGYDFDKAQKIYNYEVVNLNSYTCAQSKLFGRLRESYSFGKQCADYIAQNQSHIKCIYINTWPMFAQYFVINAAKKYKIKSIIHIQDIYPESLTNKLPFVVRSFILNMLIPVDKFVLKNATRIIAISSSMIEYLSLKRKVQKSKFELVRNWQDESKFSDFKNIDYIYNEFVFMFVGSISPSAGVLTLINSFDSANLENSKLIIAGNGSDKENCISRARLLKNENIEFVNVNSDKVSELQSKANVLLLPLRKGIANTATPSKLTAYLMSAKPIIATVENESDVANIIKEAACGFVVKPEDEISLIETMKLVRSLDKNILIEKGISGQNYALNHFSKKTNLQKIIHVVESTLE